MSNIKVFYKNKAKVINQENKINSSKNNNNYILFQSTQYTLKYIYTIVTKTNLITYAGIIERICKKARKITFCLVEKQIGVYIHFHES